MAEGGDEDITVTKLKLKSGDHVYVKTRWIEDESFCITVLNGSLAWSYHSTLPIIPLSPPPPPPPSLSFRCILSLERLWGVRGKDRD